MECKWHSGTEADLVCLKCGQAYCRECVIETREAHYCPDCHRETVERLAAQMGPRKEAKPPKVKEPKPPKEPKAPRPPKEDKKLRKPVERPMGPTIDDLGTAPPPPVERPEPTLTPQERAAFWGDGEKADDVAPFTPVEPRAPRKAASPPVAPQAPSPKEPLRVEGMPPPLVSDQKSPQAPGGVAEPLGQKKGGRALKKRPIPSKEEREAAVMAAEGFPTVEAQAKAGRRAAGVGAAAAVAPVAAVAEGAETLVPQGRIERMRAKRSQRRSLDLPVAMQIPDDYDGEVTAEASYLKAVLFGLGAGIVLGAAFAALAWLVHKDLGIFGWVIGFAVGVAVAYGSGWHFSWKLGLIAAAITMLCVSIQRIGYFMLDVRFNKILPLKLGIWPLFRESATTYWQSFWSLWLVFFLLSGLVAFIVACRPPPIKLQLSNEQSAPRRRVAGGKA